MANETIDQDFCVSLEMVEMEETQKKTFGKWVQYQLSRHPDPSRKEVVTDLYYDLRDGHVLLDLLEVIVKPHFKPQPKDPGFHGKKQNFMGSSNNDIWKREQGSLRVHHLANAGTVLNILRDSQHPFSKCVNINSVDIVDGKRL